MSGMTRKLSNKQIYDETVSKISSQRLIFLLTGSSLKDCTHAAENIREHGFDLIALDFRIAGVRVELKRLKRKNERNFGVFRVFTGKQARIAINAGARFVFSTHSDKQIIRRCRKGRVFHSAGALTPNEIHNCNELGADSISIYPCKLFKGIELVQFLKCSYPETNLIPTDDFESWEISQYLSVDPYAVAIILDTEKGHSIDNMIGEIKNFQLTR